MKAMFLLVVGLGLPEGAGIRERTDALYAESSKLCKDPDLVLDAHEHALYCPVAAQASRCPALAEACAREPRSAGLGGGGRRSGEDQTTGADDRASDDSSRDTDERSGTDSGADVRRALREQRRKRDEAARDPARPDEAAAAPDEDEDEDRKLALPYWLRQLASLAFYVAIAALVFVVARMLFRHFASARDDAPSPAGVDDRGEVEPPADRAATIVETDVARLLARARARAAAGDHRGAIEDAYAALLRRLEGAGLVELHPSKTNGDYLERLRQREALRSEIVAVVREVERVQFGDHPVGAAHSSRFFELTRPFFERALAIALLFGASALEGCDLPERSSEQPAPMHPSGYEALLELLDDAGVDAALRTSPLADLDDSGTLVLLPDVELDEPTRRELEGFAARGGQVVFVGGPQRARAGIGLRDADSAASRLELRGAARTRLGTHSPVVAPRWALEAEPSPSDVLRREGLPYAVELERGDAGGRIALFADETLFSNLGLALGDNAAFTVRYLASLGGGRVELVDGMTGLGTASPVEAVRRAELLPVLLQLLFVFGLYAAWRGARFGKPKALSSGVRRAYVEHAVALGALYRRARAAPHAAGLVSSYALDRLRERVASPERRGLVDLAERVAARSGRPLGEVVDVLERAHRARAELVEPQQASRQLRDRPAAQPARPSIGDEREADRLLHELDTFLELDDRMPLYRAHLHATNAAPASSSRSPRVTEDPR